MFTSWRSRTKKVEKYWKKKINDQICCLNTKSNIQWCFFNLLKKILTFIFLHLFCVYFVFFFFVFIEKKGNLVLRYFYVSWRRTERGEKEICLRWKNLVRLSRLNGTFFCLKKRERFFQFFNFSWCQKTFHNINYS